jgi:hypothetical protein
LEYTSSTAPDTFSFTIADSVKLVYYPFLTKRESRGAAYQQIDLPGMKEGVPAKITIDWLGREYSGTITYSFLQARKRYGLTYQWESTGAVIIHP